MIEDYDYDDDSNRTFASYLNDPDAGFFRSIDGSSWFNYPQSIVLLYLMVILISLLILLAVKMNKKPLNMTRNGSTKSRGSIPTLTISSSSTTSRSTRSRSPTRLDLAGPSDYKTTEMDK